MQIYKETLVLSCAPRRTDTRIPFDRIIIIFFHPITAEHLGVVLTGPGAESHSEYVTLFFRTFKWRVLYVSLLSDDGGARKGTEDR